MQSLDADGIVYRHAKGWFFRHHLSTDSFGAWSELTICDDGTGSWWNLELWGDNDKPVICQLNGIHGTCMYVCKWMVCH